MDVLAVDVLGGGLGGLGRETGDWCFGGAWGVGGICKGDLAILVFGDVWVMTGPGELVRLGVLLVGLVGRRRLQERRDVVMMRCGRRRRCIAVAED